ncbi:MAG: hypothetical protein BAJALOKI1v1_620008 [Promethearchaeota archaeon]|nr:MAG: hypothetical protein BAJALOKI1v1_620008 [Candidatus Lokiarchaeota archaeon]
MNNNLLKGTRVYLSGPMDFVGSRIIEKFLGWRSILSPILKALEITVLDPWNKPEVKGHKNYGQEGIIHSKQEYEKDFWTNNETRARFETEFWETVHIDLRMVDLSDFLITFVPTNIYSVGTVHEVVTARLQLKPVLMISPPIKYEFFPEIHCLPEETKKILKFYGLKQNPKGIPSQWYGNIVGGHYLFDGFGFEDLQFKSPTFYQDLIHKIIENNKPQETNKEDYTLWKKVKDWVEHYKPLQQLKGSILDHIKFKNSEESLLRKELEAPNEKKRRYFWYNSPYKSMRPMLYQLFKIASGYIPPRLQVVSHLDENGDLQYNSIEVVDDSWLLMSHEDL